MALSTTAISERAEREESLKEVLGTLALEGLTPSGEAMQIFERYVTGELSLEEMGVAVDELIGRSVRLSRNADTAEPIGNSRT